MITGKIASMYKNLLLKNILKNLFSINILGNPKMLVTSLRTGVQ